MGLRPPGPPDEIGFYGLSGLIFVFHIYCFSLYRGLPIGKDRTGRDQIGQRPGDRGQGSGQDRGQTGQDRTGRDRTEDRIGQDSEQNWTQDKGHHRTGERRQPDRTKDRTGDRGQARGQDRGQRTGQGIGQDHGKSVNVYQA